MGGTLDLLVRLVISMAVVMGIMAIAARLLRRRQGPGGGLKTAGSAQRAPGRPGALSGRGRRPRPEPAIEVVFRRPLSKGASVTVVQAGGTQYLLGVTERSVNLLAQIPPAPALEDEPGEGLATLTALPARRDATNQWEGTGRTPVPLAAAGTPGLPVNAWKLAIDSLRERTVRR